MSDEPVEFTNLVTYTWHVGDGKWVYESIVLENPLQVVTYNPDHDNHIINVLQITRKQAEELEK